MAEERMEGKARSKEGKGEMTVSEAGHMGGEKVKELIEEGKESERKQGMRSGSQSGRSSY